MSRPVTQEERSQERETQAMAGPTDNVVSTACPRCHTRFATLAHYARDENGVPTWFLRCTVCGNRATGDLKPRKEAS